MPRSHAAYLTRVFLLSAILVLVVLAFNVMVDSYRIFGTPPMTGFNAVKHGVDRHARIAKAYAVRGQQPEVVLLGTSRAESTLDPEHPLFRGRRTYNLAFPGASLYEQYRYLQHATCGGQLKAAVVALDFFQFIGDAQWVSEEFSEERLACDANGLPNPYPWQDLVRLSLSGSAFKDSWWSMRRQKSKPSIYRIDGYRDDSDDIPEMLAKPGGQHREFVASEKLFVKNYSRDRQLIAYAQQISHSAFEDLAATVAWANARGLDLVFLIPPVHARHLELIQQLGLWPEFESWKRRMVEILAASKQRHLCLWDFADFNALTGEAVPREQGGRMRWWRESSHATRATGEKMLDAIRTAASGSDAPDFGRCLTPENAERSLAEIRSGRGLWVVQHEDDAAEVATIVRTEQSKGKLQ